MGARPYTRIAAVFILAVVLLGALVYGLSPSGLAPTRVGPPSDSPEASGTRRSSRTVRKIVDIPKEERILSVVDRSYQTVADQLDERWIRCAVDVDLPGSLQVDGVRRHRIDDGVFRGMVSTRDGGGILTPVFEKTPCDSKSARGFFDCRIEEQERRKDASYPVATLEWWGAEAGGMGRCTIQAVERVTLRGRVEGARMGAVWACGVRVLTRDGTFEVEGYAHTSCLFRFDDGSVQSEIRLPTGDGSGEFVLPTPSGNAFTELEKQALALETAEAAMAQSSQLESVLESVEGEHRDLIEHWLVEETEAEAAAVAAAKAVLDQSLGMEESMKLYREKLKEWDEARD